MRQPRPASPSEDHHDDERKLHLAENLWKALVFVFAELKAIARFIWRSPRGRIFDCACFLFMSLLSLRHY